MTFRRLLRGLGGYRIAKHLLAATLGGVESEVITWANESASMGGGPSGRAAVAAALQADTGPLDGRLWLFGGMLDASTYSDVLSRHARRSAGLRSAARAASSPKSTKVCGLAARRMAVWHHQALAFLSPKLA